MELPNNFWLLFIANLPIVAVLFVALQKRWIIMGVTFTREMDDKDKDIAFREQLRQEALNDRRVIEERDKEKTDALRELTEVVKQTLELNDRLLNEALDQGWDGHERRATKITTRARRSA